MRTRMRLAILVAGALSLSGCAIFLVSAGAAAGYAVSRDSVRNTFDLPKTMIFNESLSTMRQMGQVLLQDPAAGEIKGKIGGTSVWITVKPLTKQAVQLRVKARNSFFMPNVDVAEEVYNKIIEKF